MKQAFKLWPLLYILGCASESQNSTSNQERASLTDDIFYASPVELETDHYKVTEGKLCKKNSEVKPCSYDVAESRGQIKIICKQGDEKTTGARYHLIKDTFFISSETKGFIYKQCGGEFKIYYMKEGNHESINEPVMFTPKDEEKLKQPKKNWSFKLLDVENKPAYIAKYEAQLEREAQEKIQAEAARKKQLAEEEKRLNELKKNWSQKNYQGNSIHFSKKDALLVSDYLGMMSWYDATMNCRNQSMRLPTLDEMESLSANGLCTVAINNCEMPIWTDTSRKNDRNVQRNMMVGNGAWTWAEANGQGLPSGLMTTFGVLCVR